MVSNETKMFKNEYDEDISLNDLFTDIYRNSKHKSNEIKTAITVIMDKMDDSDDVMKMMPLVRDLYEIGVKNDDELVKLAAIVQKYITSREKMELAPGESEVAGSNTNYFIFTQEEKDELKRIALENMPNTEYKLIDAAIERVSDGGSIWLILVIQ